MRKSILISAFVKMMEHEGWQNRYDPNEIFNVSPHDYKTEKQYLNALRKHWQNMEDPYKEYSYYVNVNDYDDFYEYREDIKRRKDYEIWGD